MERMHGIGGKAVLTRIGLEFPPVESAESAIGANPQVSRGVLEKRQTLRLRQSIPVRVVLKVQELGLGRRRRDQMHAEREDAPLPDTMPTTRPWGAPRSGAAGRGWGVHLHADCPNSKIS